METHIQAEVNRLEVADNTTPALPAPISGPAPAKKPKKQLTAKQLESARRNMELGRQKRKENIANRKMAGVSTYQVQEVPKRVLSDIDESEDDDSDYEELVYNPIPKPATPASTPAKGKPEADTVQKMADDLAMLKAMLAQTRKPRKKATGATVVNVQLPPTVPAQPVETENPEAVKQKKKMLMVFGGSR